MPPRKRKRGKSPNTEAESSTTSASKLLATRTPKRQGVRNRRGRLKDLPKMPLDIVFEIFVYLEPLDLLNLSRTSKDLRGLLLNKSSELIWKAARRNVEDLPDCPSFLSELAFVNLLFLHYCHKCLKPNVKHVQWTMRSRFCKTCLVTETMPRDNVIFSDVPKGELGIRSFLADHKVPRHSRLRVFEKDFLDMQQRLRKALDDGIPYKDFRETQQALSEKIEEFARVCQTWHQERTEARLDELYQIKQARLHIVIQRLRDRGWGAELDYLADTQYLDLRLVEGMKEPKPFTEHAWSKLLGPVEERMDQIREELRELNENKERRSRFKLVDEALHSWRQEYHMLFPHVRQFVLIPEVQAILDRPMSESVTADHLAVLKPILPDLVARWRRDTQQHFFSHLIRNKKPYRGVGDEEASTLALTLLFRCWQCGDHRSYPEVLTHCCPVYIWVSEYGHKLTADSFFKARIPEPGDFIGCLRATSNIIRLCGLDPHHATRLEMDALNLRFCSALEWDRVGYTGILDWRLAAESYASGRTDDLMQLSEEDATRARELEDVASHTPPDAAHCAHCPMTPYLRPHLAKAHNITEPTISDCYYHPDSPVRDGMRVYFVKPQVPVDELPASVSDAVVNGTAEYRDIQINGEIRVL